MKKAQRDITVIGSELLAALQRETTDIIVIGNLLLEAQEQLEHGFWLTWLKFNFGLSTRTAQNYMNAARFTIKYATVAHLKLRPTALYALGQHMDDYSPGVINKILKVAETDWVNDEGVYIIVLEEQQRIREEQLRIATEHLLATEQPPEVALRSEIDDILDGPPPELPPPPEVTAPDITLPPFDQAVETLSRLRTKALSSFVTTTHPPDKIRVVADFLRAVADTVRKKTEQTAA